MCFLSMVQLVHHNGFVYLSNGSIIFILAFRNRFVETTTTVVIRYRSF